MKTMPLAAAMALALAALPALAVHGRDAPGPSPDAATVSRLIDDTTKDSKAQAHAVEVLVGMGRAAVPALVPHLGDGRPLAERSIILPNRPGHVHDRQFEPWTVHDAVIVLLREVAPQGPAIGSRNLHTVDPGQRAQVKRTWVNWCIGQFPTQSDACRS
ncbi:hypothetical protein [Pinirhizobacter sp.]|uniref:hypothetical protein n=1 Tax=Pinirhizobacter sp. TaxID=2950432 RepID=UPI002F41574C